MSDQIRFEDDDNDDNHGAQQRHLQLLADLNNDFSELRTPDELMTATAAKVARCLNVPSLTYCRIDEVNKTGEVIYELGCEEISLLGTHQFKDFMSPELLAELKSAPYVAIDDLSRHPLTATSADYYARRNIRAQLKAGFVAFGQIKFLLTVYSAEPRAWRADEARLLSEITARLWLRLEHAFAEAARRESEHRFQVMSEAIPAKIWMSDRDSRAVYLSRRWEEFTGQTPPEGHGNGWLEVVHPDDRDEVIPTIRAAIEQRKPFSVDLRIRSKDGEYRWAINRGRPFFNEKGRWHGYIGSIMDVHEHVSAENALREADRRKDRFLAILSHELRNPLAPIKLNLELLELVEPGSDAARKALEVIERQSEQLSRLVDDLLDVTRVSRNKIKLHKERLELGELITATIEDYRTLFEKKKRRLCWTPNEEPVFVCIDRNRIAQCVGNLLQNAVKFTGKDDRTEVSLHTDAAGNWAEIHVVDTGIGIDAGTLTDLFDPFTQADTSLDRPSSGLGLGLSLVKGLVELHNGEVHASSDGVLQGAEFVLRLPLDNGTHQSSETPEERSKASFQRVLIVEDNEDIARSLERLLVLRGHTVKVVLTGTEALEATRDFAPSVVICDIGLPGIDGYTVAERLRADSRFEDLFLIAMSGYAMPDDIAKAMQAGFDRHIAKPPNLRQLEALIQNPQTRSTTGSTSTDSPKGNPA